MGFELFLFLTLGGIATISAAAMIYARNAVHSALFLIINFGCIALLFLMLDAPFISMVQIAVYAGAIMVLFLFVIMLLNAEQTSDTDGKYRWVTGAATVLALIFVSVLGMMIVNSGGLDLPEADGADPMVRFVHGAEVTDPVSITISGAEMEEALTLEGVSFGESSDFLSLAAGAYTVSIASASGEAITAEIDLAHDELVTVLALGQASEETLSVLEIPHTLDDAGSGFARVTVVNGYTQDALSLVDIGANAKLDTISRDGSTDLRDIVLVDGLNYGVASDAFKIRQGEHPLRFVQETAPGTFEIVSSAGDWPVEEGTEQLILLVPDYDSLSGEEGYRARILDHGQESLIIPTAEQFGSPVDIGRELFTTYLLPVNLVGFLLLVALIGVIVLTRPAGLSGERRSTINRRRKVNRPLVSVISQQTGGDVLGEDQPQLGDPASGD